LRKHDSEFVLFQKYFKEYQQRFGLNGYQVYFKYEPLEDSYAEITIKERDKVVTVRLQKGDALFKDIKKSAKHEALHLLLSKLEHEAEDRFTTERVIDEITEELVVKLQNLIP
jgi:hypothetical protein